MWDSISAINCITQQFIADDMCQITFNKKYSLDIPLVFACFFSNTITQQILNDFTQRKFWIKIDGDSLNSEIIDKLHKFILTGTYDISSINEKIVFAKLLLALKCNIGKNLLCDINEDKLTDEERIQWIAFKYELEGKINDNDLFFICTHFSIIINEKSNIHNILSIPKYLEFLEIILANKDLRIENEDMLLKFILSLCKINCVFNVLIKYIWLEYCTISAVRELIAYSRKYLCCSEGLNSLFVCFERILTVENVQNQSKIDRYNMIIPKTKTVLCNHVGNDLNGIFEYIRIMNNGQNPISCGAVDYSIHINRSGNEDTYKLFEISELNSQWGLKEIEDNNICFDFKEKRVSMNGYTWHSTNSDSYWQNPNCFSWEGSNDKETWELIDSKDENTEMGGGIGIHYWSCTKSKFYRYIRFKLRKVRRMGSLYCAHLEIFGEIQY